MACVDDLVVADEDSETQPLEDVAEVEATAEEEG